MDKCQSCMYFARDDSTGSCDCLRMEFLNNFELENYINAETKDCSQFEAYNEAEAEAEDNYYEELGGIFNV